MEKVKIVVISASGLRLAGKTYVEGEVLHATPTDADYFVQHGRARKVEETARQQYAPQKKALTAGSGDDKDKDKDDKYSHRQMKAKE